MPMGLYSPYHSLPGMSIRSGFTSHFKANRFLLELFGQLA